MWGVAKQLCLLPGNPRLVVKCLGLVGSPVAGDGGGGELPIVRQWGNSSTPDNSCATPIGESLLPEFFERWEKEDTVHLAQCFS